MRKIYQVDYGNPKKAYDAIWSTAKLQENLNNVLGDQTVEEIDQYLAGRSGKRILDVGCGMGRTVEYFNDKGYDVVGIDIATAGLAAYKKHKPKAKLVCGSATDLPFREDSFDLVIIMGVFYEIEKLEQIDVMLRYMGRLIGDDCRLIYACQYPKDFWKRMVSRIPFERRWFRRLFMRSRVDGEVNFWKWSFSHRDTIRLFARSGWRLEKVKPVNQYYGAAQWFFEAFYKGPGTRLSFVADIEPRKNVSGVGRLIARFSKRFAPMLCAGLVYFQFTKGSLEENTTRNPSLELAKS